jgi:hypothetical protein
MLKITNSATVDEDRWILSGQLAGLWVEELRSNWDQMRNRSGARRYVIDLSDVTLIDERGEGLLGELMEQGAEFVAKACIPGTFWKTLIAPKGGRSGRTGTFDTESRRRASPPVILRSAIALGWRAALHQARGRRKVCKVRSTRIFMTRESTLAASAYSCRARSTNA